MLAALFVYLMMGGGGASGPMLYMSAAAENVETVVLDEVRQDSAIEIVDSMLDRTKEHNKTAAKLRKKLGNAVNRHDVTASDLDALWNEYFELDAVYSREIIELRFSLKDQLTREEWLAVFSAAGADTNKS